MKTINARISVLSSVVAVFFIVIIGRLFWLQVMNNDLFEARADRQQSITGTLKGKRGDIVVHEKQRIYPVATTKDDWLFTINPKLVDNVEDLYQKFTSVGLVLDKEEFLLKAGKINDPYEVMQHHVPNSIKKKIEELAIKSVAFELEPGRFYPAGDFASQTIGFVGADGTGQYGLERFYNKELSGEDGSFSGDASAGTRLLLFGKNLIDQNSDGASVHLTIDAGVESFLVSSLKDTLEKYDARSAGGIIINPKTGKILAFASIPSYDPNIYSKEKDPAVFQNPLVESLFEMGSVIKPLTIAAALDAGSIQPADTYVDTGKRTIDGRTIENYDGVARGRVAIQEILSQSLNMGAVYVMEQLGKDKMRQYFNNYGFAEKTNIDLPNEATGNLKNLESSRLIEYATASFGQGISMTPLALARALSSLGNGGFLVTPYIVEEVKYANGLTQEKKVSEPKRILKEETSKTITRMLVQVVDTKLANGHGKIPGYSVAAKTGTAQIASSDRRGYSGEFIHTFFGYGPAYDPQFLVVLYLEKPQGIRYASESLTEPFRAIMKHLFSYFEVLPDRPQELSDKQP
ncbi:MAG: penicillin-binding protein 2 [Patescibacteria group bacterium]